MNNRCPNTGEVCSKLQEATDIRARSIEELEIPFMPGIVGTGALAVNQYELFNRNLSQGIQMVRLRGMARKTGCSEVCPIEALDLNEHFGLIR